MKMELDNNGDEEHILIPLLVRITQVCLIELESTAVIPWDWDQLLGEKDGKD